MKKEKEPKPILTVLDLTERITSQWRAKEKESLLLKEKHEEGLKTEREKELKIKSQLENLRLVISGLEKDYLKIESRVEKDKKARIEKESLREKDVLTKKITLKEFAKKGIFDKDILKLAVEKSTKELTRILEIIRKQNIEAIKLEYELCKCQNMIRNLLLNPITILEKVLKDCSDILNQERGFFLADNYGSRDDIKQIEVKLHLIEKGKSLSRGFQWDSMSVEEAKRLIFDPIIPQDVILQLKTELLKYADSDQVSVAYHWRSHDVEIRSYSKR